MRDDRDEKSPLVDTTLEASRTPSREDGQVPSDAGVDAGHMPSSSYELGAVIATGGMGRIFAARDRRLGRPVAIKQLLVHNPESRRRFQREIRLSARLQHPSIVNILEAGQWANGPFYAMKLVSGRPLVDVIKERKTLNERLALLPNVIAAADALAYAHDQRIIHRDLKPHNVLVGDFGETVVIDWGLAKDMADHEVELPAGPYRVDPGQDGTAVGTIMGTPAYMPPEQARGQVVDQRADVYALGAVLYHVLAGSAPFSGGSSAEILKAVLAGSHEPIERRQPGVPADLVTIVNKAMAADPAARYASAAGLADDLKRFQTGQLVSAHEYSLGELVRRFVRRHRAAVVVAAALLAVLVGGALISVRNIVEAEHAAEEQRDRALDRSRALILEKARALLGRDPTAALASLRPYLIAGGLPRAARIVAADAWTRGVSRRVLRGHESNVPWVTFLPDGTVVSTSVDGTMRLWAPDGSARVFGKPGQSRGWQTHAPDGRALATRDSRGGLHWLWDVTTGASRALETHPDHWFVEISTDSRWLVATGKEGRLHAWSLDGAGDRALDGPVPDWINVGPITGRPTDAFLLGSPQGLDLLTAGDGRRVHITDVAPTWAVFDRDGSRIASMDAEGTVRVFTGTGTLLHTLRGHNGIVRPRLAFTADGRYLLTCAQLEQFSHSEIFVWDLASGTGRMLAKTRAQVNALLEFPTGHRVATADSEGLIEIWDVEQATSRRIVGHDSFVYFLAISADGSQLASAGLDATVRVWELADLAPTRFYIDDPERPQYGLIGGRQPGERSALAGDASELYGASGERKLVAWSLVDGSHRVLGHTPQPIEQVVRSPDSRTVASIGGEPAIRLFDVRSGSQRVLEGPTRAVSLLAWAANGVLASGELGGGVRLWDVASGAARRLPGHDGDIEGLAFSADGRQLASGDAGGAIRIWDAASAELRATLTARPRAAKVLAFSPDGRQLAAGGDGGAVQLWDLSQRSAPAMRQLIGHKRDVRQLAWSPDGMTLASCSSDHTIRLWRGDEVQVLTGHSNVVISVAWAPDGQRLVSASSDHTARLWDVTTGAGRPVPHDASVGRVAFLPDGVHVVSWSLHEVQLWTDDLPYDTPGLLAWIDGHTDVTADAED